jgi:hypothetical protein
MSYFILAAILLGLVVLAAPISLGYDSVEKWFKVKWLGLTITKRWEAEKPEKPRKIKAKKKKKQKIPGLALGRGLWQKRELCLELIGQGKRFVLDLFRTLSFRDSAASFSLPDPMWNGLLYAVAANIHLQEVNLSVNFENRNYAKIRVTVYPYRVAWKLAAFLVRLPYIRLLRFAWDLKKQHRPMVI